jgi:REP element-mobilizing transposase RayT
MSRYIRPKVPGASVFFTVNLVDRRSDTLVRHVGMLREAVAVTKAKRPFGIDAWVVLSDHMNCVWTLPEGDADSSGRWREIKGQFSMALRRTGRALTHAPENPHGARGGRERAGARPTYARTKCRSGKNASGKGTFAATKNSRPVFSIAGLTPSSTGWSNTKTPGPIPNGIATQAMPHRREGRSTPLPPNPYPQVDAHTQPIDLKDP